MFQFLQGRNNVLEIRACGKLTSDDYRRALVPRLAAIHQRNGKVRVLFLMDETFEGWTLGAAWLNTSLDIRYRNAFEKLAIIGAPAWEEWCLKLVRLLVAGEIRTFPREHLDVARAWLRA
jgi:hypothetical protein